MSRYSQPDYKNATTGWLSSAVKNNPEGLLLLAAGCALLMRSGSSRAAGHREEVREFDGHEGGRRQRASYTPDKESSNAREELTEAVEGARDYASAVTEKVAATASSYSSSLSDYADRTRRAVSEQSGRFARQTQSTLQDTMSRVLEEQPLALAVIGLAAGAAVAAALPATRVERRVLGRAGERVTDAAESTARHLKKATESAGEELADAADERGLNAEGLKQVAGDVASAFGKALTGEHQDKIARLGPQGPDMSAASGAKQPSSAGRQSSTSAQPASSQETTTPRPAKSGRSGAGRASTAASTGRSADSPSSNPKRGSR